MKKITLITMLLFIAVSCQKKLPVPEAAKKDCFIVMAKGMEADATHQYYTLYRPDNRKDTVPYEKWKNVYFGQEYCK